MENILIVEDTEIFVELVETNLLEEGYRVFKAVDGREAAEIIQKEQIDLAILDIMLPDTTGFELCKKIREKYRYPIIMLTSVDDDANKIKGLTIGADDYICKPFNPLELVARVKTQLRRYKTYSDESYGKHNNIIMVKDLKIDINSHKCFLDKEEVNLTPIEFKMLTFLCEKKNIVVTREELFEKVWGTNISYNNSKLVTNVGRLREKIKDDAKNPRFVKSVWGVGYKVEE